MKRNKSEICLTGGYRCGCHIGMWIGRLRLRPRFDQDQNGSAATGCRRMLEHHWSPPSIWAWSSTSSFVFSSSNIGVGTTFSYLSIIKINFSKFVSIIPAFSAYASPTSPHACTCSWTISRVTNATTFSTSTCISYRTTPASKSPSPPMPSLAKTCWFVPPFLAFIQIFI